MNILAGIMIGVGIVLFVVGCAMLVHAPVLENCDGALPRWSIVQHENQWAYVGPYGSVWIGRFQSRDVAVSEMARAREFYHAWENGGREQAEDKEKVERQPGYWIVEGKEP